YCEFTLPAHWARSHVRALAAPRDVRGQGDAGHHEVAHAEEAPLEALPRGEGPQWALGPGHEGCSRPVELRLDLVEAQKESAHGELTLVERLLGGEHQEGMVTQLRRARAMGVRP